MKSKFIVLVAYCLSMSACRSGIYTYVAYDGPEQPVADLATLHIPRNILVESIDNMGRYYPRHNSYAIPYKGAVITVTPGRHTAALIYDGQYAIVTGGAVNLEFTVEAGLQYTFEPSLVKQENDTYIVFKLIPHQP